MRTVTFSNREVQKKLMGEFRLAWLNIEGDDSAGASFAHEPGDPAGGCTRGVGEHNVQILFTTAKGELLHAVAGYLSPEDLLDEIALAVDLNEKIASIESQTARRKMVEMVHRRAAVADKKEGDDDLFADHRRNRLVKDHGYCRKHPLMDARDFRPTDMVGKSQTFFGSTSGGNKGSQTPGQIGTMPKNGSKPFDFDEIMRDLEARKKIGSTDHDRRKDRGTKDGGTRL